MKYSKLYISFLGIVNFFLLFVVVYSFDKGIALSDDAFQLIGYLPQQEVDLSFLHLVIKRLLFGLEIGIFESRIIHVLSCLLSSLILAYCFWIWLKKELNTQQKQELFLPIFLFILLANLLSYSTGFAGFSYNTLNPTLLYISLGIFFLYLTSPEAKYSFVYLLMIGSLSTFTIINKISSGLCLSCIYPIILLLYKNNSSIKKKLSHCLALLIGLIIGFMLYFLFFQSFENFTKSINQIFNFLNSSNDGHSSSSISSDAFITVYHIIRFSFISFVLQIGINYIAKYFNFSDQLKNLTINLIFIFAIVFFQYHFGIKSGSTFLFITVFFLVYLILHLIRTRNLKKEINLLIILSFLFILPFIGGIGTNRSLLRHLLIYLPFHFIAIVIVLNYVNFNRYRVKAILIGFSFAFFIISLYQPYAYLNLFKQTEKLELTSREKDLKVDIYTKTLMSKLKEKLMVLGYFPQQTVIGFNNAIGIIYLFNGLIPGGPVYSPDQTNLLRQNLKYTKKDLSKAWIILDKELPSNTIKVLNEFHLNFPDRYQKCQVDWVLIYKPVE
jgi:hypothetical protein